MIDALLVALLIFLAVRGWFRGLVREAMDLVGLILGIVLAFRLGSTVGALIEAMSGISADAARLVGGLIVLVVTGIAAALVARVVEPRVRWPGLNLIDRAGGASLGLASGAFAAVVLLSLAVILPIPEAVSRQLDSSALTRFLTDPAAAPQAVFRRLSGDRVVEALLNLNRLVGERRVIVEGEESVALAPADPGDVEQDAAAATEIFDLLNRARLDTGADPLAWSPALAVVAQGHAVEMYLEGYFSHNSPATGTVADRLEGAGITYSVAGENLALAATPTDVHNGLMGSPGHRENILRPEFRRVGVAVVAGPLGLMTVQVFTG
ncbi:MAG TPA: CvpA family protein [Acidimicrobiia bacterium]|nr:CvpA family protein [Acidimicrobiia bacterium]